jgi:hypothetical protein
MADGNPLKKSEICKDNIWKCKNLEEIRSSMDGESYECKVCGEYFKLYYDDMK